MSSNTAPQFPIVTPSQLQSPELVSLLVDHLMPIAVFGAPGSAKTHTGRQLSFAVAAHLDIPVSKVRHHEFNLADKDAFEMNGVVVPVKPTDGAGGPYTTKFTRAPLMEALLEHFRNGYEYILLQLEEVTQCGPDMLKSTRHLVDTDTRALGIDRMWEIDINGKPMAERVFIFMTGNRMKDKAGSGRLLSHFSNAIMRFEMGFSIEEWVTWAHNNDLHPMQIACAQANAENNFFVDAVPAEDVQFCTARTFARCTPIFHMFDAGDGTINVTPVFNQLIAAWIGDAAADVVVNYLALSSKLPSKQDILTDPEHARLDDNTGVQFAAAQLALSLATSSASADAVLRYVTRMRTDLQISTGAALLRKSVREGFLLNTPLANQFVAKYATVLPNTSTLTRSPQSR
jgi:hypothetical protein